MSEPPPLAPLPGAAVHGSFHRAHTEEWSNYDSVLEEMRSIYYTYVEALRLASDGSVVGMAKVGAYSTDPNENGALNLDPENPESFNFVGRWEMQDRKLTAQLGRASRKVSLSPKWVGIFYLPERIVLTGGEVEGNELRAEVTYDSHPVWEDEAVSAVYKRLERSGP